VTGDLRYPFPRLHIDDGRHLANVVVRETATLYQFAYVFAYVESCPDVRGILILCLLSVSSAVSLDMPS